MVGRLACICRTCQNARFCLAPLSVDLFFLSFRRFRRQDAVHRLVLSAGCVAFALSSGSSGRASSRPFLSHHFAEQCDGRLVLLFRCHVGSGTKLAGLIGFVFPLGFLLRHLFFLQFECRFFRGFLVGLFEILGSAFRGRCVLVGCVQVGPHGSVCEQSAVHPFLPSCPVTRQPVFQSGNSGNRTTVGRCLRLLLFFLSRCRSFCFHRRLVRFFHQSCRLDLAGFLRQGFFYILEFLICLGNRGFFADLLGCRGPELLFDAFR